MPSRPLSRRAFLKTAFRGTIATAAFGAGGYVYATEIEPQWIDVTELRLTLPRLSAAFDGYRIVQISDLHADDWMTGERLSACMQLVNEQQPDLVAITGDFVTWHPNTVGTGLIDALRLLTPRDQTVAVLGNHDHWTSAAGVRSILRQSDVLDISNAVHTIERGTEHLHLCGVDDIWEEQHRLDMVLADLPAAGAAILLAHEPDFADESAATGRFDLQLSGHSHGGQVVLPLLGPPVLPYLGRTYPLGLYQVDSMWQYTNRGVGAVSPRVRLNCRPEIAVLNLAAADP